MVKICRPLLGRVSKIWYSKKAISRFILLPRNNRIWRSPPEEAVLIRSFLKDKRFLVTSFNEYYVLGVGTIQLYNVKTVYNHKRHGDFDLGGRMFSFRVKPPFPSKTTPEFLLVDLLNNIEQLAEDSNELVSKVRCKAKTMNTKKVTFGIW
jgi:hypothetical protein